MMAPGGYPQGGRYPQDRRFPPDGPPPGWDPRWTPDGYAGNGSAGYEGDVRPGEPPTTSTTAQQVPAPKPVGPPPALTAGPSAAGPSAAEPIVVEPIVVEPIAVEPKVAAEAPSAATQPKLAPRPEVASPSGSIKLPPAPELPANPPELPDPQPAVAAVPVAPVPAPPVPAASVPVGTVIVDGGEDVGPDDDTAPIPVITPDMPKPEPAVPAERIRAPFEPLDRKPAPPVKPPPVPEPEPDPESPEDLKLDQIKDLYLTAEAIGEDALAKHFQQVSDRQRQLIREYFDQVATRGGPDDAN